MSENIFYRGVIEDNNDPEKLGRLRVRIFGLHSDDVSLLPTENLPWCEVAHSLEGGFISGIGKSFVPQNGTFVWCFLECGNEEKPVIFASCPGISKEKETGAFTDPSGKYPLDDRLGESDFNRLARGEKTSETPSEKLLSENLVTGVALATGDAWDEPSSTNSQAQYPFNNVTETASGHIIQIDDTEGNERIQIFHKTGAYIELKPDGNIVLKSSNDFYEIAKGNFKQSVALKSDITINADKSELIGGNFNYTIGKTETKVINESYDLTIAETSSTCIGKSCLIASGEKFTLNAPTSILESDNSISLKSASISGEGDTISLKGSSITGEASTITLKGSIINLN